VSDLERVESEAQRAREEAEAATRRATELEGQATTARERARQEQEARRRVWAQGIVDAYDPDLTKADAAIQTARDRFNAAAVKDLTGAIAAYLAWAEAVIQHYVLQVRLDSVTPLLGLEATPPERAEVPSFSRALDGALGEHVSALSDRARDKAAAEIERMLDPETGTAPDPGTPAR
jgi:hypothetical protein